MKSIEYTIIYIVLVIYTLIFTVIYLKRVLYMAFLTMIAPLVAITYPLDKMSDNKAQGFNMWFKEYCFNALLQPFHFLIYTVLIGSVMDLAGEYPIYALVALGFIIPAEKMLKTMFGFNKAESPSSIGTLGVAGASMLMSGVHKLSHKPSDKERSQKKSEGENKIRIKDNQFDTIGNYANSGFSTEHMQDNIKGKDLNELQFQSYKTKENPNLSNKQKSSTKFDGINNKKSGNIDERKYDMSQNANLTKNLNKKKTLKNRVGNGLMNVGSRYNRKLAKSHPLRKIRRGVTYGVGAASLGMLGLAAGIASGDLEKTFQYTTAAGMVGGKFGKNIGDSLSEKINNNVEAFKQGWYGTEYQDKMQEKQIKELSSSPENIEYVMSRTSDYKNVLNNVYPEYARNGCSDIKDFWAAYQLEQQGYEREKAIATYKLSQKIGDVEKSPDAEDKWKSKLQGEFENSNVVKDNQKEKLVNLESEYKIKQDSIKKEYEKRYKEIEKSNQKNKEKQYKKIHDEKKEKYKQLQNDKNKKENTIREMPKHLSESALNSVKQFYKNRDI